LGLVTQNHRLGDHDECGARRDVRVRSLRWREVLSWSPLQRFLSHSSWRESVTDAVVWTIFTRAVHWLAARRRGQ